MAVGSGYVFGGRFVLQSLIGTGGMGEVYRGLDMTRGEPAAIKLLRVTDRSNLERFCREAAVLAELTHPAIVRYVAHGVSEERKPYLVMEWLEGETLQEHLRHGPLSAHEAYALARRVSEGLSVAHARGVAHRDIKPSNLFLVRGAIAEAKILDFGIAKRVFDELAQLTRSGARIGTPAYMSPEQVRGQRIDARTDVFSLGATLYECVTGNAPFPGDNPLAMAAEICLQDPPWPRSLRTDLPKDFERVIMHALQKNPADRPRDARELSRELLEIDEPAPGARMPSAPPTLASNEQRVITVVVATGLALARTIGADETVVSAELTAAAELEKLCSLLAPFQARFEHMANGMTVVCFAHGSAPSDQTRAAAQFVLSVAEAFPDTRIAVGHGRAVLRGRLPLGAVVERAAALVESTGPGIRLDTATAELLAPDFHIETTAWGARLLGQRELDDAPLHGPRTTPFVGRTLELRSLEGAFVQSIEEQCARGALVLAPPGMGKTRLARELVAQLRKQDLAFTQLTAQGDPIRSSAPFSLLSSLVRHAAAMAKGDDLTIRQDKLRNYLQKTCGNTVPRTVIEFIGELSGVHFSDAASPELRAARQDHRLMGEQIKSAWLAFLHALIADKPALFVLEDLHWADLSSVQLIDSSLRALADCPLFVLTLARPEVQDRFPALWEGRRVDYVRLLPLTARASERLVREVLGPGTDSKLVKRIVSQAEGNALFLEELMRAVATGNLGALPDTVMAVIQMRLDALGMEAGRVLRAASIFGEEFSLAGVGALTGQSAERLREYCNLFEARDLISLGEGGAYLFRHALVRETCYAALTPEDRSLGHRLAGAFLEESTDVAAAVLAEHFDRGDHPQRAARWYAQAAANALEGSDMSGALCFVERGIELGAAGEIRAELRLVETQVHAERGAFAEAETSGRDALCHTREASALWYHIVRELVSPLGEQGKSDAVRALIERVDASVPERSAEPARLTALCWMGGALTLFGQAELASDLLSDCAQSIERLGDAEAWVKSRFHYARATHRSCTGMLAGALADVTAAAALAAQAGDASLAGLARNGVGKLLVELGMAERAVVVLEDVLTEARAAARSYHVVLASLALIEAKSALGRFDEARQHAQAALRENAASSRLSCVVHMHLARMEHTRGELDAAERLARRSLEEAGEPGILRFPAKAILSRVMLSSGRPAEALAHAREALAYFEQGGPVQDFDALIPLVAAEALYENGEHEAALRTLAWAHNRLLERAARIEDAELRQSFLHAVADHARTLELAAKWGATT